MHINIHLHFIYIHGWDIVFHEIIQCQICQPINEQWLWILLSIDWHCVLLDYEYINENENDILVCSITP